MNTKLIVAFVLLGVLTVAAIGLVSAQVASPSPSPNGAQTDGVWGWMGRCLGRSAQCYGTQAPGYACQPTVDPNTGEVPYQGYCGNGYGCGRMRGLYP